MKLRFCMVKDCEILLVDSFIEELKARLQCIQAISTGEGFPVLANGALAVWLDM